MKKYFALLIGSAALLMTSCKEDTVPQDVTLAPQASTESVTDVKRASAIISGSVTPMPGQSLDNYDEFGLLVSRNPIFDYTHYDYIFKNQTRVLVTGLLPGNTYYFAPYVKNAMTVSYGNVVTFTTSLTNAPEFNTLTVTRSTETSGSVSTTLKDVGAETSVVMRGYIYKLAPNGEGSVTDQDLQLNSEVDNIGGIGTLNQGEKLEEMIPNLLPGKTYAVRAYAVAEGVGYSNIAYIKTIATDKPTLSVIDEQRTRNGILSAYFIQEGTENIEEVGFCYTQGKGSTPNAEGNGTKIAAVRSGQSFTAAMPTMGLNVTYAFRPYALTENSGYVYGEVTEVENSLDLDSLASKQYVADLISIANKRIDEIVSELDSLQRRMSYFESQLNSNTITLNEYQAMIDLLQKQIVDLQTEQRNIVAILMNSPEFNDYLRQVILAEMAGALDSVGGVQGPKGDKGDDGLTPYIGNNGNWWIGDTDTNVRATGLDGANGQNGQDGQTPELRQGTDGNWYWWIGDTNTNIRANGSDVSSTVVDSLATEILNLKNIIAQMQNMPALPAVFQNNFTVVADSTGVIASAAIDYPQYVQNYVTAYGSNSMYGDTYYAELYPIVMTGFLYSETNPEPNTDSYAEMIVARADASYAFSAPARNLKPGTKYYVRAFAVNSFGASYSTVREITTSGSSSVVPSEGDNPYPGTMGIRRRL